jgi:hypothetical protein
MRQIKIAATKAMAPSQFTDSLLKLVSPVRFSDGNLKLMTLTAVAAMKKTETLAIKMKAMTLTFMPD